MAEPGDDWITVTTAAGLLGLRTRTVNGLIDAGEIAAEVVPPATLTTKYGLSRRRRSIRLRRTGVEDYLDRARIKPGELRHLHPNWTWERYG